MAKQHEKPKKELRYTDGEMSLIKVHFCENKGLTLALRNFFLQIATEADQKIIGSAFKGKEALFTLLKKVFLPKLSPDIPHHQNVDLWSVIPIQNWTPEQAYPHFIANEKIIAYFEDQFDVLQTYVKGKIGEPAIVFADLVGTLKDKEMLMAYVDMEARNKIISHTEFQLNQLAILGGFSDEKMEQTKDRLLKDSTK